MAEHDEVRSGASHLSVPSFSVLVRFLTVGFLACGFGSGSADEQKDGTPDEKQLAKQALEISRKEAGLWEIELAGERPKRLKLQSEPVLRWSNPSAGQIYGAVFVWTSEGRPEVVGSIYKWYSPFKHYSTEFQSLAATTITGLHDGNEMWTPARAGVEFKPVPDAPVPAEGPVARLRQMREIAGDFVATKTDREGNQQKLRMLTQPIYRYDSTPAAVQDGALFTFVEGTDPEVFLMVESRRGTEGFRWQYALTRMNSTKFEATFKGNSVWSVEVLPWSQVRDRKEPYTTFQYNSVE